jgi:hypothetical protein
VGSQLRRVEYSDRPKGRMWKSITAGLLLAAVGLSLQPPALEYRLEVPFIASPPRAARLLQINAQPLVGEPIPFQADLGVRGAALEVVGLRLEALQRLTGTSSADGPLAVVRERGVDQPTVGRLVCRLSAPIAADQIDALLDAISRPPEGEVVGDAEHLRARRWARWRVETYEHYAAHDAGSAPPSPAIADARLVGFPSMTREQDSDRVPAGVPAVLAGLSGAAGANRNASAHAAVEASAWASDASTAQQLERWRQQLSHLDQQSTVQLREARGFIVAQQPPRQRPVARDSLRPQLRTLALAAAGGLLLVWFPWSRLGRRSADDRSVSQRALLSDDLPTYLGRIDDLGSLQLPSVAPKLATAGNSTHSRLPREWRWSGRNGAAVPALGRLGNFISWRLADSLVAAWGTFALVRFMLDEQWRVLARFEPLTALASLLQRLS